MYGGNLSWLFPATTGGSSGRVRQLSWQLLRAQEEERRHLARELPDRAGQTLVILSMNLASLSQQIEIKAPELAQPVKQAEESVQELTKEIRTTSYLLHPPLLDENGLPAALSWYVRGSSERGGLDVLLNISEKLGRLPKDVELLVFRLIQECLTNVHRHSGSKTAAIQIDRDAERDFSEAYCPNTKWWWRVGIRGMRERLHQFQGELLIDSDGMGTKIKMTIPLRQDRLDTH